MGLPEVRGRAPLLNRHVLEKFRMPREKDPKRPLLDEQTIKALLSVAREGHPFLHSLIILAWRTGRRLSSILNLRWEDADFEKGTIRWRAEHDKIRQSWVVPMQREVRAELVQFRKSIPGSARPLSPSAATAATERSGYPACGGVVAQGGLPTGQARETVWKPLAHVQKSLGHGAEGPPAQGCSSCGWVARYQYSTAISAARRRYHAQGRRFHAITRAIINA
jgi:integrase